MFTIRKLYAKILRGNEKGTKAAKRMRRFQKCSASEILLNKDLISAAQPKFVSNDKNKKRFICMSRQYLQDSAILFKEAPEDADALIVHTAIHYSSNYESVVIVGEDVDLLVILSQFAQSKTNIYFCKPSTERSEKKYTRAAVSSIQNY